MDDGYLINIRNGFLDAVAAHPMFPWPGPPPGMENKPSASKMGEAACMRQVWAAIMARTDPAFDFEMIPDTGEGQMPPQRGWILEDSVRFWLNHVPGIVCEKWEDSLVIDPEGTFFGHPDGIINILGENALLEIKHQNAMAYVRILEHGLHAAAPVYYSQVQAYMLATGLKTCLVVVLPFDLSGAKGTMTQHKRYKSYAGQLEPDFRMILESSGIHPAIYFEMVPAMPPYQKYLVSWARKLAAYVESGEAPDRGFDLYNKESGWHCRPEYCTARMACDIIGPCGGVCSHVWCIEGLTAATEDEYDSRRD